MSVLPNEAVLQEPRFVLEEVGYEDSTLPVGILLTSLTAGQTYLLEITTTDGGTPEVADRTEFLYQGEMVIRFLAPP